MYKLTYTATLQQADNDGNDDGDSYTFSGQQVIANPTPQNADFATASGAMAADLLGKIEAGFPLQSTDDSDNSGGGGQG